MPRVSLIMPAYNAEQYIETAISSVRKQTFKDWELLIVNDGSTDATESIAKGTATQESRIKVLSQANSGMPGVARNYGLNCATGDYLGFLDADDYYEPERIERILDCFEKFPELGMVFHDMYIENCEGRQQAHTYLGEVEFGAKIAAYINEQIGNCWRLSDRYFVFMALFFAGVHTGSVMIRRSVERDVTIEFRDDLIIGEDTELWIRVAEHVPVAFYDKPLSTYRRHGHGITADQGLWLEGTLAVHEIIRSRISTRLTEAEKATYDAKIRSTRNALAYHYLCTGQNSRARSQYYQARDGLSGVSFWCNLTKTFLPWRGLLKWKRWLSGHVHA